MATSVVMPALEMAQETGKIVSWLKQEGDRVAKGEMLLEVETDKAVVEVEALADGILSAVTGHPGDVVPVGQTIAWLLAPGESVPQETAPVQTGRRTDSPAATPAAAAASPAGPAPAAPGARISPKARRLAQELGVDLSRVTGSGAGGEILADDITAAARTKPSGSAATTPAGPADLGTVARLMAERTTTSWTTVPHFFVTKDVDAGALMALRDERLASVERETGVRLTHTDLLVAVVARVLRRHPRINSSWDGKTIRSNDGVSIGLAVAVDDGVVAVTIPATDAKSLGQIASVRRELGDRAKTGRLHANEVSGATFTISNLGMFGTDAFSAIIVPPQAAILAVGAIADRAVVRDGQVVARPMMTLTLSSDHRVIDGARAATFMRDLAEAIARPDQLI